MRLEPEPKVALFLPMNAVGHFQGLLAIANQLRADYKDVRCVFAVAGPLQCRIIEDHGHELIKLEDQAEPLYDFEIEPDEDLSEPLDEAAEQLRLRQGKKKRAFEGAARWPQFMARHQSLFKQDAKQSHLAIDKFARMIISVSVQNSKQMDELVLSLDPDVILCDDSVMIHPAILKTERARPWVRFYSPNPLPLLESKLPDSICPPYFQGYELFTKEKRAQMRSEEPEAWRALLSEWDAKGRETRQIWHDCFEEVREYYRANGCGEHLARSPDLTMTRIDSPYLNLYMFPEALDYDQDDDLFERPAGWLRCDSLIRRAAGKSEATEREHWLQLIEDKKSAGLKSVVYFSLGSIASGEPNLMQRLVDFLASDEADRLYIVSKGVNGDQVKLNERNMIGANYLPQTFLLQQANLAIIHGGNNSLTESLYYGKPVIVLPGFGDQPDNAQRVADLGLGKRLDLYKCTRDELLAAINEVESNQKLAARARAIGAKMQSRDELGKVSTIIRELIEKRQLSEQTAKRFGIKRK